MPNGKQIVAYIHKDLFERMEIQRQILLRSNSRMSVSWFVGDAIQEKVERMEREDDQEEVSRQRERQAEREWKL